MDFGRGFAGWGLIVIGGPTATGKSGLGMAIAQRFREQGMNAIILSADSRQVYREFDIGTAKPSITDQQAVPHFLIDICDPTETLTLADYQERAQAVIAGCHGRSEGERVEGRRVEGCGDADSEDDLQNPTSNIQHPTSKIPTNCIPLLVGGTGLYIKSIVRGLKMPRVPPHTEMRSQLASLGQPQCYALLQQVDPDAANPIHPNDQVRTLRALEVFYVTGIPMSQQQGESPPDYPILQLGLDCTPPERLHQRIQSRTEQMVAAGFVDEVRTLRQRYGADLPLLRTLGYQEMGEYLDGTVSLEGAIAQTVIHTRQFSKRQRTWFRADPTITWLDADNPDLVETAWSYIAGF